MKPLTCHWSLYALLWIVGMVLVGSLVGLITFPLAGLLFSLETPPGKLALSGLHHLGFYACVWAPGTAIVMTFKREYERRHRKE